METIKRNFTPEIAYQKIKHYCGYQERNHQEVKEKLYSFGLRKSDVEVLISKMIEEDYLNEERFATAFARGRFNLKNWGKKKIEYELKQKRVSDYNIRKALQLLDFSDYNKTLDKLAETKWKALKGEQYINRQVKTTRYLLQKGFENAMISVAIKKLMADGKKT